MVHGDGPVELDGVEVEFDDERAVSDAAVMLVATLAQRLGVEALAGRFVRLRRELPGTANTGRKVMALIYAMVLGADSIDDTDVLGAGRTGRRPGGWVPAPSTLGTFLCAFTVGHVRQLDRLLGQAIERAWKAGARPGPSSGCVAAGTRGVRAPPGCAAATRRAAPRACDTTGPSAQVKDVIGRNPRLRQPRDPSAARADAGRPRDRSWRASCSPPRGAGSPRCTTAPTRRSSSTTKPPARRRLQRDLERLTAEALNEPPHPGTIHRRAAGA